MLNHREEFELVEFAVGDCFYGIMVEQVREIIRVLEKIVPIPDAHSSIEGAINLRGAIIPIINLAKHLHLPAQTAVTEGRIIVSSVNDSLVGFWVTAVARIHRILGKNVEMASDLVRAQGHYTMAATRIDERIVFILDFGKIIEEIGISHGTEKR